MATEWQKAHPEELCAYAKKYRETHREKIRASRKKYREANPEKIRARFKKWTQDNPEKRRAGHRRYYEAHPENSEESRARYNRWAKANPEKVYVKWKKWCEANPEKARVNRAIDCARRKQRLSLVIRDRVDPYEIFDRDKWKCRKCGVETPIELHGTYKPNAPVMDHIIPVTLGGPHTRTNLQCLCRKCNATKSARYKGQLAFL